MSRPREDVDCPEGWDIVGMQQVVYAALNRVKLTTGHVMKIAQADDQYAQTLSASLRFLQEREPSLVPCQGFEGFTTLGNLTICLASAHSKLSEELSSLVVLHRDTFYQEIEMGIKTTLESAHKLSLDLKNAQLKLDKCKTVWLKANRDLEELQDKPETSKKKMKLVQETTACSTQYQQQITEYNDFQQRSWNDYRKIVNDMKKIHQLCIKDIEVQIKKLLELKSKYTEHVHNELEAEYKSFLIKTGYDEFDQFISTNKAMQQSPQQVQFANYQAQKKKGTKVGNKKDRQGWFGVSVDDILLRQRDDFPSLKIPFILVLLRDTILEIGGPLTEGIFRISGAAMEVQQYRDSINDGDFSIPEDMCVHVICSIFKLFLRELPVPLIPTELYNTFIQDELVRQISETSVEQLVFEKLPASHRDTLKCLLHFASFLALYESITKMTIDNLSLIFSQCLLQRPSGLDPMAGLRLCDLEKQFFSTTIRALTQSYITSFKPELPPPPPPNTTPPPPPTHTRDETIAEWQRQQNLLWGSIEVLKASPSATAEVYMGLGFPQTLPSPTRVGKGKKKDCDILRDGTPKLTHSARSSCDARISYKEVLPTQGNEMASIQTAQGLDDTSLHKLNEPTTPRSKPPALALKNRLDLLGMKPSSQENSPRSPRIIDTPPLPGPNSGLHSIPPPATPNSSPMSLSELQKIAALKSHSSPNLFKNIPPPVSPPYSTGVTFTPAPPRLQISSPIHPPTPNTGAASARLLLPVASASPPLLAPVSPTLQCSSAPIPVPVPNITNAEVLPHTPKFPTLPTNSPTITPLQSPSSSRSPSPSTSPTSPTLTAIEPGLHTHARNRHHSHQHRHTFHTSHAPASESNLYSLDLSSSEEIRSSIPTSSKLSSSTSPREKDRTYKYLMESSRCLMEQLSSTELPLHKKLLCIAVVQANKSLLLSVVEKLKSEDYSAFYKISDLLLAGSKYMEKNPPTLIVAWDNVATEVNTLKTLIGYIAFKHQCESQFRNKFSYIVQVLSTCWLVPNQETSAGGTFPIVDPHSTQSASEELSTNLKNLLHKTVQEAATASPLLDKDQHKNIVLSLQLLLNTSKLWVSFFEEHQFIAPTLPGPPTGADPNQPDCNISAAALHTSFLYESELLPSLQSAFATFSVADTFPTNREELDRYTTLLTLLSLLKRTILEATLLQRGEAEQE
ncbi:DNA-dependent DNA helicase and ATPase [Pelomyxa schiedti]|nr:DNA-dependent DNA helicase and ATPase [Pelomyxa schiedti]